MNPYKYKTAESELRTSISEEEREQIFRYVEEHFVRSGILFSSETFPRDSTLARYVQTSEETWQEMLIRLLNEKGMTNPQCYKKVDVDRKLFSKIMKNRQHAPQKNTAVRLALALELPLQEAKEMLEKAGYALSHSSKRDLVIEYFFLNRKYDLYELNDALSELGEAQV